MASDDVAAALEEYFQRLVDTWRTRYGTLPRVARMDDVPDDPRFPIQIVDDDYLEWLPTRQAEENGGPELMARWSVGLRELLSTYWFLSLGGHRRGLAFEFDPVLPGWPLQLVNRIENYRESRPQRTEIPVGFESRSGSLLVIDPITDVLLIDDLESDDLTPVDAPLGYVIRDLTQAL